MSASEALRRIRQAREEKGTALDLSQLGLRAIPREVGQLVELQKLDIGARGSSEGHALACRCTIRTRGAVLLVESKPPYRPRLAGERTLLRRVVHRSSIARDEPAVGGAHVW